MENNKEKNKKEEFNIDELKKKLEDCQKTRDEYLAGWQRARADFLNYKKEEMERIGEIIKYGNLELILKLLPILDNFDLIEKKLPEDLKTDKHVIGILQIKKQIKDILESQGLEEMECLGKKFDPNFQEAVEEIEKENIEPGTVVEEVKKGYIVNGKLLRPAKVKVAK